MMEPHLLITPDLTPQIQDHQSRNQHDPTFTLKVEDIIKNNSKAVPHYLVLSLTFPVFSTK